MSGAPAGIGTDIVSVGRFDRLLRAGDGSFLRRWFTPEEVEYCLGRAHPARHLAARFAAKEAVVKAVGGTWTGPLPWSDIEILRLPGGAPAVRLSGAVRNVARTAGIGVVRVSMSHCDEYATAMALAVSGGEEAW
jgi:holo-[acyl-carrier protein] synthase